MAPNSPPDPADSRWTWPASPGDAVPGPAGPAGLSAPARRVGWFIAGAGVVVAVAAILPWKVVGPLHVNGTAGDGILTLVFGFLAAIAGLGRALTKRDSTWLVLWPVVALTMSAFTILVAYTDVQAVAKIATVGIGLILTLFGGVALAAASMFALFRRV